jgi:hypothetical protein
MRAVLRQRAGPGARRGHTLGAGRFTPVGDYESLDLRGSFTSSGYLRLEAEYLAPRLLGRRGTLSLLGAPARPGPPPTIA